MLRTKKCRKVTQRCRYGLGFCSWVARYCIDGSASGFEGPAVGRLHDPQATAGHGGQAMAGDQPAHLLGQLVVGMVLMETR